MHSNPDEFLHHRDIRESRNYDTNEGHVSTVIGQSVMAAIGPTLELDLVIEGVKVSGYRLTIQYNLKAVLHRIGRQASQRTGKTHTTVTVKLYGKDGGHELHITAQVTLIPGVESGTFSNFSDVDEGEFSRVVNSGSVCCALAIV